MSLWSQLGWIKGHSERTESIEDTSMEQMIAKGYPLCSECGQVTSEWPEVASWLLVGVAISFAIHAAVT